MSIGQPAERVTGIYNELVATPPENKQVLGSFVWSLKGLRRQRPGDSSIMVALLLALSLNGDVEEAHELANLAWPHRRAMIPDVQGTYYNLLMRLGIYERAIEGVQENIGLRRLNNAEVGALAYSAWGVGDLRLLQTALDQDTDQVRIDAWKNILEKLDTYGVTPVLAGRQAELRELVGRRQCAMKIQFTEDEFGRAEVAQLIYLSDSYAERIELEERLYDASSQYDREQGLMGMATWDLLPVVVLDVTSLDAIKTN